MQRPPGLAYLARKQRIPEREAGASSSQKTKQKKKKRAPAALHQIRPPTSATSSGSVFRSADEGFVSAQDSLRLSRFLGCKALFPRYHVRFGYQTDKEGTHKCLLTRSRLMQILASLVSLFCFQDDLRRASSKSTCKNSLAAVRGQRRSIRELDTGGCYPTLTAYISNCILINRTKFMQTGRYSLNSDRK